MRLMRSESIITLNDWAMAYQALKCLGLFCIWYQTSWAPMFKVDIVGSPGRTRGDSAVLGGSNTKVSLYWTTDF